MAASPKPSLRIRSTFWPSSTSWVLQNGHQSAERKNTSMAPLGPMMDFRVWVRPAWSGAAKSGTPSPTAGPVLIWPQRAAAKTASHRVRRLLHRILAWAGHSAFIGAAARRGCLQVPLPRRSEPMRAPGFLQLLRMADYEWRAVPCGMGALSERPEPSWTDCGDREVLCHRSRLRESCCRDRG